MWSVRILLAPTEALERDLERDLERQRDGFREQALEIEVREQA